MHGFNVISAVIVSGNSQYEIVGAYVPPSDTTILVHIAAALGRFPNQKVILVGGLNLDLNSIETESDIEVADILAAFGSFWQLLACWICTTTSSRPAGLGGPRLGIKNARGT